MDIDKQFDLKNVSAVVHTFKNKTDELFHYAAKDCAKYLVGDTADINCKHVGLMDDLEEVKSGTYLLVSCLSVCYPDQANRIMDELDIAWTKYDEFRVRQGKWSGEHVDEEDNPKLNMIMHVMPYIFCVMPEPDSPYQWRNYMDKKNRDVGGYCFSFLTNRIEDAIVKRNDALFKAQDSVLYLWPCLYKNKDDEKINLLAYALFKDIENDIKNCLYSYQRLFRVLSAIFTIAPIIKEERFSREQETRLILVANQKTAIKDRLPSGFCKIGVRPINLMKSIMLSPQGYQNELLARLKGLDRNIESAVKVTMSNMEKTVVDNYITNPLVVDGSAYENYVLERISTDNGAAIISLEEFLVNHPKEATGRV